MMDVKKIVESWTLPDRSTERTQITLRIQYTDYARLHALKAAYPSRSVNEILTDIIRVGLDEVVDSLPVYGADEEDVAMAQHEGHFLELGAPCRGPRIDYTRAYRSIISSRTKPEDEAKPEGE